MGSKIKSTFVYLLLLPALLFGMTACTDEEVADSIGVIAIGAGIILICSGDNDCSGDRHYRHRRPRRHRRHCFYDRHGHYVCDHHYRSSSFLASSSNDLLTFASDQADEELTIFDMGENNIHPADWAAAFGISVDASEQVVSALESARDGNPNPLKSLGLTSNDLLRFATLKLPKTKSIIEMSDNLNVDAGKVKSMLEALIETTKIEQQKAAGLISL